MAWLLFDTSIGACGVSWNDAGLSSLQLPEEREDATRSRLLVRSGAGGPMATAESVPGWVRDAIARVRDHLAGKPQDLARVPLDLSGQTPFVRKVLRAARAIPTGRTTTYGKLAAAVGSPGASRAVGRVMATNPWPVIIPCHRVVAASGGTGGFSAYGGLATKERILQIEGATLYTGDAAKHIARFDAEAQKRPGSGGAPLDGCANPRATEDRQPGATSDDVVRCLAYAQDDGAPPPTG